MKVQKAFCRIVSAHRVILNGCLFDREEIVSALHVALLSRKNIYMVGPGGEGKSMIAMLFSLLCKMKFFNQQFHSFTKIDDWEGPVDMNRFKLGELIRKVQNFAPGAEIILADELGRGGAVLSALYRLLNEGTYVEDGITKKANVEIVFAGSNSMLPAEHDALFDRFPFFFECNKISNESLLKMYESDEDEPEINIKEEDCLTKDMLRDAREEMLKVTFPKSIAEMMVHINDQCTLEKFHLSTRLNRWCKRMLKANAYCEGRDTVTEEDVWILRNVFARTVKQKPIAHRILRKICNQELDNLLFSFDEITKMYDSWKEQKQPKCMVTYDRSGNQIERTFSDILKEMFQDIKKISPKEINKAEHSRITKNVMGLLAEVSQSEINIMRRGK